MSVHRTKPFITELNADAAYIFFTDFQFIYYPLVYVNLIKMCFVRNNWENTALQLISDT